jgi:hypothetical protein
MRFTRHNHHAQRHPARVLFFLALLSGAVAAATGLVMVLWNAVLVEALGARPLGYWQALGLLLLCRVLFGNWGPRRRGHSGTGTGAGAAPGQVPSLSPEQRARWSAHWKSRCAKTDTESPPNDA